MAEFTVQELFDLFGRANPPLQFVWAGVGWSIEQRDRIVAHGGSPNKLREVLEAGVPTAEEALEDLRTLRNWARTANIDGAMTRLERYISHKEQADGS